MKKTIAMILSFTILFCLCACNNDGSQIPDSNNSSQAATNSTESSKGSTEMTTDGTEGTTAPAKDEGIREIVLPASSSKLGEDLDYKSSDTACYINVDGVSNKPKVESWDNAIVVDGVADYLDYLETLGFTVEIINTTTKEPYSGFYTHETNFKVSNEHISWTMYLFIQDEKYVEYQFDINLVPSATTEESTSVPTEGSNTVTTETPSTQTPTAEPPTTRPSATEPPTTKPTTSEPTTTEPPTTEPSIDTRYLIIEEQNGGYCVTGIASNGPSNMVIPNKYEGLFITCIGNAAGMNCTNLSSVTLPNSITRIDSSAFWGCTSLNSIIIPNSVIVLGDSVFYYCTSLSSVTISNNVTYIADNLFGWCSNLSTVNIPYGVTKIGNTSFVQCKSLYSVTLPSSLLTIENNAFEGSGLTAITIPDSVNRLGYCVFANCKNLTSVTIGNGISRIPDGTFTGCTRLTSITFTGTKAQWNNISLGDDWNGGVPVTQIRCSDGTVNLIGDIEPTEPPTIEPPATEPPTTEPPATEPPATEPPATEPPATEPPATEPASDVLIISNAQTISNQTINTDVYITSTGVVTFKNVTVNGNVYCYGKLTVSGGSANNLYAYYWDLGGIVSSCDAWDGTHGLVKGAFSSCGNVIIKDNALDYAFNKWGKK